MSAPAPDVYSAATIHTVLGVEPATLRKWVERGHVRRLGYDKYDGDTVIAHWRARHVDTASPELSTA